MLLQKIASKRNRALLRELVVTDFKLRYQGSAIGYMWSLLRPLLLFLILYLVFVNFLKLGQGVPHFPVYLLLGIVLWTFFSEMTNQSLSSIVARGELIRKIRIPRWIIVLSSSFSALINLALNLLVVAVFMVINKVDLTYAAFWFPVILAQIYVVSLGVSLFLAAAFVKYRDLSHVWEVALQGLFYLTPILYPLTMITNEALQKLLLVNPMAQAIQDARAILVTPETLTIAEAFHTSAARLLPLFLSLLFLIAGVWYFKKESRDFAENV
ncbi:MAG: ABC transporter permease [Patescibacteria group bacterium]